MIFCIFYQVNNLFLHQYVLIKNPPPSQIDLIKCKNHFLTFKNAKSGQLCNLYVVKTRKYTLCSPADKSDESLWRGRGRGLYGLKNGTASLLSFLSSLVCKLILVRPSVCVCVCVCVSRGQAEKKTFPEWGVDSQLSKVSGFKNFFKKSLYPCLPQHTASLSQPLHLAPPPPPSAAHNTPPPHPPTPRPPQIQYQAVFICQNPQPFSSSRSGSIYYYIRPKWPDWIFFIAPARR